MPAADKKVRISHSTECTGLRATTTSNAATTATMAKK